MKTRNVTPDVMRRVEGTRYESPRHACLTVLTGDTIGQVVSLADKTQISIGREGDVDLALNDDTISRHHADVFRGDGGGFSLRDVGSTNGTFCNGEAVQERALVDGDKILLGERVMLKFTYLDVQESDFHRRLSEQRERDGEEFEKAREIQRKQLPPEGELTSSGFRYSGVVRPATKVGGDWWYQRVLGPDRLLMCIADVTGHGMPSALLTASAKGACDSMAAGHDDIDLDRLITTLDGVIREAGGGELVMTFFAAVLDRNEMRINFANAGHNFPILIREGVVSPLIARGGRLGDLDQFNLACHDLETDDVILFFTDGLLEMQEHSGKEYGQRRLLRFARQHLHLDPDGLREAVLNDALSFAGGRPADDDITLVVCRV